jgi:hypothetical protein
LVDVYRPALIAGGITFDPEDPTSFPLEASANILRACSEQYIVSMLMANVDVQALAGLTNCTYTPDSVPRCATRRNRRLACRMWRLAGYCC